MTRKTDDEILQEARKWCAVNSLDHTISPYYIKGLLDNNLTIRTAVHFINQREDALEQAEVEKARADKLEQALAETHDKIDGLQSDLNALVDVCRKNTQYNVDRADKLYAIGTFIDLNYPLRSEVRDSSGTESPMMQDALSTGPETGADSPGKAQWSEEIPWAGGE